MRGMKPCSWQQLCSEHHVCGVDPVLEALQDPSLALSGESPCSCHWKPMDAATTQASATTLERTETEDGRQAGMEINRIGI